jgi:hypothetical protein
VLAHLFLSGSKRQRCSDLDSSWGHRSDICTRKGRELYGYGVHVVACTRTGLPVAWQIETALIHQAPTAASLHDTLALRVGPTERVRVDTDLSALADGQNPV